MAEIMFQTITSKDNQLQMALAQRARLEAQMAGFKTATGRTHEGMKALLDAINHEISGLRSQMGLN